MKSASGVHYIALDHVRALAAFLVFSWHFVHGTKGSPVPYEGVPPWGPLVFLDEGHVGVALFMTLSGYLFAKLLDGKRIRITGFLWNRLLRLAPLFVVVMLMNAAIKSLHAGDMRVGLAFLLTLPHGLIGPSWPNGGWSIAAELHFYLLLPFLLFLQRRALVYLVVVLLLAIAVRAGIFWLNGTVQKLSYLTIAGRIDQFVLGILAFSLRGHMASAHWRALFCAVLFISAYYIFAGAGGFYGIDGYPSRSALWVALPFIEGLGCASLLAWYDTSFNHGSGWFSRGVSRVGEYSYAIYLLHFFFVFQAAEFIHGQVMSLGNFYIATAVSLLAFLLMVPVGYLSMRFIEAPFLRRRRPYYDREVSPQAVA